MERLKHKAGLRVAERMIILEIASHFSEYYLILQNVVSSVIRIGFNLKIF